MWNFANHEINKTVQANFLISQFVTIFYFYYRPRDTNRFKVSVNVAAQNKIKFTLTYNELLQRRRSNYDHTIYIRPRQIVDDFRVEIFIQESRQITYLRVPPLRDDVLINYNSIGEKEKCKCKIFCLAFHGVIVLLVLSWRLMLRIWSGPLRPKCLVPWEPLDEAFI